MVARPLYDKFITLDANKATQFRWCGFDITFRAIGFANFWSIFIIKGAYIYW